MIEVNLRPFWCYYGGKWRAAPHYPKPRYRTIVEPFAGAAGYSLRYPDLDVILVEKYPIIAAIWRWLISVNPEEVRAIPEVDSVDDLPEWVSQPARWLVGFSMNAAASTPRRTLSAGRRKLRAMNCQFEGWTPARRERVASQVTAIRHWQIIEGDYTSAPDIEATWFVDPPYDKTGKYYPHHKLSYRELAAWCRTRRGQVMVCENDGANWLPFERFGSFKASNGRLSIEALWIGGDQ